MDLPFLNTSWGSVIGGSPERLMRLKTHAKTRPLPAREKGEQKVSRFPKKELLADPKERAEHAMLVDLMRNDLGCSPGSVRELEKLC